MSVPTTDSVLLPYTRSTSGAALAWAVMALSGAAGLGWQMLWTAQLATGLGHEMVALLGVLAAFFGGIAIGSLALAKVVARSPFPGRWYASLEAVIAVWGLLLVWLLPHAARAANALLGPNPSAVWHWTLSFGLPLLLLLPATAAMGATLPALERQLRHTRGRLAGLYAANTLGAVAGVVMVVFWWLPVWGLQHTGGVLVAANAVCALVAWGTWRSDTAPPVLLPPANTARQGEPGLTVELAATGLLGVGYEVLAVRVLSQVTENTVYSYALLLAVYLAGTAGGAALLKWRETRRSPADTAATDGLLVALATAVLLGGLGLWWADRLCALPVLLFGASAGTALAGEVLAASVAMLLPTLVMGALFTRLCLAAQARSWPLGRALAINTAGAALAPLLFGVVLLPAAGAKGGLVVIVLGYLLLTRTAGWRQRTTWLPAAAVCSLALLATPLRFVDVPRGGELLHYREGVAAAVSIARDAQGVSRLRINNRAQEGSTAGGAIELRLAQIPLLLHPRPTHALMLGLGTGYTANAAAIDGVTRVKAVELLPEVVDASVFFMRSEAAPRAVHPVQVVVADARRYVQADTAAYDVVVADLFHPARSGAGALYTVEQFADVRQRLAPGGVFCQWLALHQMEPDTLRRIVAAFVQVYPEAVAVLASNSLDTPVIGLVARPGFPLPSLRAVQTRMDATSPALRRALDGAGLHDAFAVLGSVVAGPAALARFAAGVQANTDDRPGVVYAAPWDTYAPQHTPRQRLGALLEAWPDYAADDTRLQAYAAARHRYLELGLSVQPEPEPQAMLAQLQAPLLGILSISPDFTPAAEPLRALAAALQRSAPQQAAAVLAELRAVQSRRTPITP
jgi:spermidine synthase